MQLNQQKLLGSQEIVYVQLYYKGIYNNHNAPAINYKPQLLIITCIFLIQSAFNW